MIGAAFLAKIEKEAAAMQMQQGTDDEEFKESDAERPKKSLAFGAFVHTLKKKMKIKPPIQYNEWGGRLPTPPESEDD